METKMLQEMASYLKEVAIVKLINYLKQFGSKALTDSQGISTAFHKFGVNMRYLGDVHRHELLKQNYEIKRFL